MKKQVADTSIESYHKLDNNALRMQILRVMSDGKPRTAHECAGEIGRENRDGAHPRLSDLKKAGLVARLADTDKDDQTGATVHYYQITEFGLRFARILEERECSKTGT